MNEEKYLKQLKMKKTLGIIVKIFMYVVLAVLIAGAVLLICAESGIKTAQSILSWVEQRFGLIIGASALGALLLLLKALMTVYNTTNSNEANQEQVLIELNKIKDDIMNATGKVEESAEKVAVVSGDVTSRNEAIDEYKNAIDQLGEQQGILFETMKLFVTANTNDAKIKSIFSAFEETKLFEKARALAKGDTVEVVQNVADIQSTKELLEKSKEIIEPVVPVAKEIVRTIIKK